MYNTIMVYFHVCRPNYKMIELKDDIILNAGHQLLQPQKIKPIGASNCGGINAMMMSNKGTSVNVAKSPPKEKNENPQ